MTSLVGRRRADTRHGGYQSVPACSARRAEREGNPSTRPLLALLALHAGCSLSTALLSVSRGRGARSGSTLLRAVRLREMRCRAPHWSATRRRAAGRGCVSFAVSGVLTVGVPSRVPAFFPRLSPLGASSFRASADASIAYTAGDRASVSARARGPGGQVVPPAGRRRTVAPGATGHGTVPRDARARGAARERRTRANATDPPRPRVVHNRHRRGHRSYHAGARAYERGRRRIRVHDDDTIRITKIAQHNILIPKPKRYGSRMRDVERSTLSITLP